MRIVFDSNVIVDAIKPNALFEAEAQELLRLASINRIYGLVSANSLSDIFYVLRKGFGAEKSKAMIKRLTLMLDIIGIEPEDCSDALELDMNDFEDALIAVCAQKANADCIVSRDERFIKAKTSVEVITPAHLLARILMVDDFNEPMDEYGRFESGPDYGKPVKEVWEE